MNQIQFETNWLTVQEPTGLTLNECFNLYGYPDSEKSEEEKIQECVNKFLREGGCL